MTWTVLPSLYPDFGESTPLVPLSGEFKEVEPQVVGRFTSIKPSYLSHEGAGSLGPGDGLGVEWSVIDLLE